MTDITELAQSMKAAANKAKQANALYLERKITLSECVVETKDYLDYSDNPNNILALVEELENAQQRIAELEDSHKKLRESVAAIHNTILIDGVNTRLVGIMNTAKRAFEESKPVADGSLTVQGD